MMAFSNIPWKLRVIAMWFAVFFMAEASTACAQYSRYGRFGYGGRYGGFGYGGFGYGGRYGGFGYGKSSYGFGRNYYSPSYRYGSGYRGFRNYNYQYSPSPSYRYSPSYSSGYRYGSGDKPYTRVPVSRDLYFRTNLAEPVADTSVVADVVTIQHEAASGREQDLSRGWRLLAEGNAAEALKYFGKIAQNNASAAEPKVGYALSALASGDVTTASWAMRRALSLEAGAVYRSQRDEVARGVIAQLIGQLEKTRASGTDSNVDYLLVNLQAAMTNEVVSAKPSMEMQDVVPEASPPIPTFIPDAVGIAEDTPSLPTLLDR